MELQLPSARMTRMLGLLSLGFALTFNPAHAAEPMLPQVQPPAGFDEGTETSLSGAQMSEIIPWANNSKDSLTELLATSESPSFQDTRDTLVRGIQDVVLASAPKRTEMLMRYVLNRALKVNALLEQEMDLSQPGAVDLQIRILRNSIETALRYYESDLAYLNGRFIEKKNLVTLPFSQFGVDYANTLMTLDQSIIDASAQYGVAILALGLLQWDLYRDSDRLLFSTVIGKINNFLKFAPPRALANDADTLNWIKKAKKIYLDSVKSTVSLMAQAKKKGIPAIDGVSLPPEANDFNFGLKSSHRDQIAKIISTCSSASSDPSKLSCYNAMLDGLGPDPLISAIRTSCTTGIGATAYYTRSCLVTGLNKVLSSVNFLRTALAMCTELGNNNYIKTCYSNVIAATRDAWLISANSVCTVPFAAEHYYVRSCQENLLNDTLAAKDSAQLVLDLCEVAGNWKDSVPRTACYRVLMPSLQDPTLVPVRKGCAAMSTTYEESNCYQAALKSRLPTKPVY